MSDLDHEMLQILNSLARGDMGAAVTVTSANAVSRAGAQETALAGAIQTALEQGGHRVTQAEALGLAERVLSDPKAGAAAAALLGGDRAGQGLDMGPLSEVLKQWLKGPRPHPKDEPPPPPPPWPPALPRERRPNVPPPPAPPAGSSMGGEEGPRTPPPLPVKHSPARPRPSWSPVGHGLTMNPPGEDNHAIHRREIEEYNERFAARAARYLEEAYLRNIGQHTEWWEGKVTLKRRTSATITLEPFPTDRELVPVEIVASGSKAPAQGKIVTVYISTTYLAAAGQVPPVITPSRQTLIYGVRVASPVLHPVPPRPVLPRPMKPVSPAGRQGAKIPDVTIPDPPPPPDPAPPLLRMEDFSFLFDPTEGDVEPDVPPPSGTKGTGGEDPRPSPPPRPPARSRQPKPHPEAAPNEDGGQGEDYKGYIRRWGTHHARQVVWRVKDGGRRYVEHVTRFYAGTVRLVNVDQKRAQVELWPLSADGERVKQDCGFGVKKWTKGQLLDKQVRVRVTLGRWEIDDTL